MPKSTYQKKDAKELSMKIKEIEIQTGITSHNIRFYEKEKLIFPKRNPLNGYREYTEQDVELLKRIKLLRMLNVPVSDIRECIEGKKQLSDVLTIRLEAIKAEENRIRQNHLLCEQLAAMEIEINDLPAELIDKIFRDKNAYVYQLEQLKKPDRMENLIFLSKQITCILGWLIVIVVCLQFYFGLFAAHVSKPLQIVTFIMTALLFSCIFWIIYCNEKKDR